MNKDSLSVQEFADAAGVKIQTIYKQLYEGGRLEPYEVLVKGRKRIKVEALEKFYDIQLDSTSLNPESQLDSTDLNPEPELDSTSLNPESQPDSTESTALEVAIQVLQEQLERKDKQIEKLQEDLHDAYRQISEMAQKAQYITAADKTEKIMQQQPQKEEIVAPAAESKEEKEEPQQQKKSFWSWLFKR